MIATLEREVGIRPETEPQDGPYHLEIDHGYQPHRKIPLRFASSIDIRYDDKGDINDRVYNQVYRPIWLGGERLPNAYFSFYAPFREWVKAEKPEDFEAIRERMQALPDREYRILGDTAFHDILPLLPVRTQDLLIKMGIEAAKKDLGFRSKGIWLPETAVSPETITVLHRNGYEFMALRKDQLESGDSSEKNPMWVKVLSEGDHGEVIGELAVVHFDKNQSEDVAFKDWITVDADEYIRAHAGRDLSVGTDFETFGHHLKFRDKFFLRSLDPDLNKANGFSFFDVRRRLVDPDRRYTTVKRSASSCPHENFARWRGACGEGNPEGKGLFDTLSLYGYKIDSLLDQRGTGWEKELIDMYLEMRETGFADVDNKDPLLLAKMYQLLGMTSCGWYFRNPNEPTAEIPRKTILEIGSLLQGIALPKAA